MSVTTKGMNPPRSRTRAFLLTLVSGQTLTLATMLVGFVATPVILRHLGPERFGVWRVLEVWIAYVGLIPQCVAQAASFLLVPALAGGDPDRLRRLAATGLVVGGVVATLSALGGTALVPVVSWIAAAGPELAAECREAFLIAVLAAVPVAPLLLLRCVLEADQKGYLVNAVLAVQTLTVTVTAVGFAVYGYGLPGQAWASAVGIVLQAVLFVLLTRHDYPWARPGRPDRHQARTLLRRSSALMLLAVLGGVAARVEYPLVAAFDGATATTQYSLAQRLFLVYGGLVAAVGNSIWAPLADLYHRGETVRLRQRLDRAVRWVGIAGTAGAVSVAVATPSFLRLWVGEGFDPGATTRLAFATTFPLLGLNILVTWVLTATGHHRAMLLSTGTYFAVTVASGVVGGYAFGVAGVAWGIAAGVTAAVLVNLAACRGAFGLSLRPLAGRLLLTAALAVVYGRAWSGATALWGEPGWPSLLLLLAAGWVGYVMLAFFVLLTPDDRAELRHWWRLRRSWR